jgi:hypothetical protein
LDYFVERLMAVWWMTIIASLLAIGWFASDREPPFEILSVPEVSVRPGEWLKVTAEVRRDVSRGCDAVFSRYIFSGEGVRYDLGTSHASAAMISAIELRHPGKLPIAVLVPGSIEPGRARLEMVLSYRCNQVHALWPIVVTTEIPFTVLP